MTFLSGDKYVGAWKNGKQHGKFKSFHRNGKLSMVGDFFDGKQNGEWFEYYDDGSLYWRLIYKNGVKKDGVFRMYHKNGKIRSEVLYENDKPASNWIFFEPIIFVRFLRHFLLKIFFFYLKLLGLYKHC